MLGANYTAAYCINQDNISLVPGLYSSLPWAKTKDNYSIYWDVLSPHKKQGDGSKNERIVALKKLGLRHVPTMYTWSNECRRTYYRRYFATLYRAQPGLFKILEARIRFNNKYGAQSHPSQNDIAKIAQLTREWVNKGDQTLVDLGLIIKIKATSRQHANVYALGWWSCDLILRRELSMYMPSLGAKLHSDFTPIIYNSNSKIILNLDSYPERDGVQKYNLNVHDEQPDDMSVNEWRKVRVITSQKVKGSERYRAQSEIRERSLNVRQGGIMVKLGEALTNTNLVAPRGPRNIMTNSAESAKLLGDKGSFSERNSAVNHYHEDDESQPYKPVNRTESGGGYGHQRPVNHEQPRAHTRYIPAQYQVRPEEEANELRRAAIQNPALIEAYEKNVRIFGEKLAADMLKKLLDSLEMQEISSSHTIVIPHA